jgi:endo-alpha-1,4-polygalactosaminidase (GH114 family)
MIDVEVRSEERFSRISIAYQGEEEAKKVVETTEAITKKYDLEPDMHTCDVSSGKCVLVIEYHDDTTRESGKIFKEIMDALDVKECI